MSTKPISIGSKQRRPAEEIFAEREKVYQESYRADSVAPPRLAARYGDPTSRKVYMMSPDVEGRWLDLHARDTAIGPPLD